MEVIGVHGSDHLKLKGNAYSWIIIQVVIQINDFFTRCCGGPGGYPGVSFFILDHYTGRDSNQQFFYSMLWWTRWLPGCVFFHFGSLYRS